eukprot:4589255-Amphidinium_carterae.1
MPLYERVPPMPGAIPEVQGLSPRLQLEAENFKHDKNKDDSYYEKKLFDEIRQKSYILQHPS